MDDQRRKIEALLLPHLDAAYNLARWLTRSAAEAEDIVQDAMVRALKSFGGFRGNDAKPWLLTIVRNCYRTAAKRQAGTVIVSLDAQDEDTTRMGSQLVGETPDPEAAASHMGERRRLDALLATLPPDFREILLLRELEELSYREIADITGVPMGTVMSRLARARTLLKERWLAAEKASL
jgi:RNA polymerase sigma-70 factor (ECF subfamily)